jgi:hypothetical protein
MKTAKKAPVKKYKAGGTSSTANPGKRAKKIENLQAKKTALDDQIKEDAPYGHGEAWVGMTPKSQRLGKRIAKLESKPQAKSGGSVAKMKVGGVAKPKAMYGKTVKPSMMKKGGTTKKK